MHAQGIGMSETSRLAGKLATVDNELALNKLALIGTFGTETNRRALVRHSTGRVETVKMGERVAGSRVVAISQDTLFLKSGSKTRKLEMPSG